MKAAPVESPSDAEVSFISDPYVAFQTAPVFLTAPPGLAASFGQLMDIVNGDLRRLMSEGSSMRLPRPSGRRSRRQSGTLRAKFQPRLFFLPLHSRRRRGFYRGTASQSCTSAQCFLR